MVHEVPEPAAFFAEVMRALKPEGTLLLAEPFSIGSSKFAEEIATAKECGFAVVERPTRRWSRQALLKKPAT
jgi:2-polyprenyl-3-methyl-5-hydroxy-6-metoxy-1,4-benzoquinol methylase